MPCLALYAQFASIHITGSDCLSHDRSFYTRRRCKALQAHANKKTTKRRGGRARKTKTENRKGEKQKKALDKSIRSIFSLAKVTTNLAIARVHKGCILPTGSETIIDINSNRNCGDYLAASRIAGQQMDSMEVLMWLCYCTRLRRVSGPVIETLSTVSRHIGWASTQRALYRSICDNPHEITHVQAGFELEIDVGSRIQSLEGHSIGLRRV